MVCGFSHPDQGIDGVRPIRDDIDKRVRTLAAPLGVAQMAE